MSLRCTLVAVVVACAALTSVSEAQRPTSPPLRPSTTPVRRDSLRTKADSLRARGDTLTAKDTLARANFAPPDSVMQRLLATPG
jgi:hypothetical protein